MVEALGRIFSDVRRLYSCSDCEPYSQIENLIKIYDKRAVLSYYLGAACKFDCLYCYNNENLNIPQIKEKDLERIIDKLTKNSDSFEIITPGCEQELFINQKEAIYFLKRLQLLNKIISFATKVALTKRIVLAIQEINNYLKANGSYVVGEVSFVSGNDIPLIERNVPKVSDRVSTLKDLSEEGIYAVPFIRPILPDEIVTLESIYSLIDKTQKYCEVYALGDFYFNKIIEERMNLNKLSADFKSKVKPQTTAGFLNTKQIIFYKYINLNKKRLIRRYIESKNKFCYDSSSEAILHFKKR